VAAVAGKHSKLLAFLLLACACRPSDVRVLIPEGFTGWVTIEFSGAPCPNSSSSSSEGSILVSTEGRGCSPLKELPPTFLSSIAYADASGHGAKRVLRETSWGGGGEIWGASALADGKEYRFFVGSEEQFKATYENKAAGS